MTYDASPPHWRNFQFTMLDLCIVLAYIECLFLILDAHVGS